MGTEHRTGARLDDPGKVSGLSSVDLDRPTTHIGRSQKNDIVIRDLTVSGMHAAIEQQPDGHRVVDLGSTNKTLLNGKEISPHTPMMLSDGDEIRIDTFVFIYRASKQEPTASYSAADIVTSPSPADDDATVLFEEDAGTNTEETLLREKKQPAAGAEDGDETVLFD
ncbi:MAG: FHA domain-containing protein, partial [Desulfobacteraceae bacterium]|nr:FHA domain-containing protein [Desulfobacteraceae bacterium]